MSDYVIVDGVTHASDVVYVQTQAVLACVQKLWADESRTVQVLAAAVIAEHQLKNGADPARALDVLSRALQGTFTV